MRARVYLDDPKQTLEALKILSWYLEGKERVKAIPGRAVRRACRLMKLMARMEMDRSVTWVRAKEWKERLRLAGIDPETFEVRDEERWDLAWEQMLGSWTFRDDIARRQIALGVKAKEKAGNVIVARMEMRKREKTAEAADETPEKEDYFRGEIKKKIGGKRRPR